LGNYRFQIDFGVGSCILGPVSKQYLLYYVLEVKGSRPNR